MKLILSGYDLNNNLIFEEVFNGHSFYETIFCNVSDKLGLTKMGIEYRKNTREALELRKNRKLTNEEKMNCYNCSKLDNDVKVILDIALVDEKEFFGEEVNNIISKISGLSLGNLEDINSFLEEVDIKAINKLVFKKGE